MGNRGNREWEIGNGKWEMGNRKADRVLNPVSLIKPCQP